MIIKSSVLPIKLVEDLRGVYAKSRKAVDKGIKLEGVVLYLSNGEDFQRHSFRIMKNLKESLAKT